MNIQTLNLLKTKFVTREVGGELIVVPLTNNIAEMTKLFTLNETGKFIWECINDTNSFEDIVAQLTEEFDIDPVTAKIDLETFLKKIETLCV